MNYPVYNPYGYSQIGPQQGQQGPFMSQPVNQPIPAQSPVQGQQQAIQGLSPASRPVTSKEEAMGVAADFSGALMVFPDITHNQVYIKRWNFQTCAADFTEFSPVVQAPTQQEQPRQQADVFASAQDLQNLQDVVDGLREEIDRMKRPQVARTTAKKEKGEANE